MDNPMVQIYVTLYKNKLRTLEQIPENNNLKQDVINKLKEEGILS
jgi:hypothetical protein